MLELVRFDQPSGAIMFKNEAVAPHDVSARVLLWIIEVVFNHFENDLIARKRKHEHDHAARPFRSDKSIAGGAQMPDEIAVELCLTMTVVANRIVEIDQTFARHELTQAAHELVWTFRVDTEIGAREREQNGEVSLADKDRVEVNPGFVRAPQAQRDRDRCAVGRIAKRASNKISTAPPVEDAADHL